MKLFRNQEMRSFLGYYCCISVFLCLSSLLLHPLCALSCAVTAVVLGLLFLYFTRKRYSDLAELSNQLDAVLHGDYRLEFDRYAEGELSILSSELYKMTIRLREQADSLRLDKLYLRDSAADISHQLRTPLTSVRLLLRRLQKPELTEAQRIPILRELDSHLNGIDRLITALLKISQLESGTVIFGREPITVGTLIEKAAEPLLIPMELKEQQLKLDIPPELTVTADLFWTVEALSNILKNCMEHTPPEGDIFIAARQTAVYLELLIRDSGQGFAEEDIPHLFERFYKGKSASDNSIGIGLALSQMILKKQNASLCAQNTPEGGAQFQIRFYMGVI